MVVAILCLSPGHGGLELYALREHKELESRGINCISVSAHGSMLASQLEEQGLRSTYLDIANRRLPLLAAKKLATILEQNKVDILHMHWNKDLNLAVLARVFTTKKIKLVYSRHMDITRNKRDVLHRWFYRRVDLLLTTSKLVTKNCKQFLPMDKEKIQLLYLWVAAPENTTPNCSLFFGEHFPPRKLNIACFARIESYKGQHVLVSAIQHLAKEGLDISATIIGHVMDKGYDDKLKTSIKRDKLSSHIQFTGFVDNPIELMACFDVVVLTTYQETFGLVLVEAMRAGVAVIGTNAGGVPDIIEHDKTGLLTEPGSAESLALAIKQLYENPTRLDKLSTQGKARADEHFADEIHFNKLKSTLTALTGRK